MKGKKTEKKSGNKKKRALLITLCSLAGVILAGVITVVAVFFHFYNMTNYEKDPETVTADPGMAESIETFDFSNLSFDETTAYVEPGKETEPGETMEPSGELDPSDPSGDVDPGSQTPGGDGSQGSSQGGGSQGSSQGGGSQGGSQGGGSTKAPSSSIPFGTRPTDPTAGEGKDNGHPTSAPIAAGCAAQIAPSSSVYNILLIGVDRPGQSGSNADANILLSINNAKHTIYLTSIMRDSLCYIPGYGWTKMNSGFALWGYDRGGYLMASTLNATFGFPINNYAWTTFSNMIKIIDILGGLDMQLTPREAYQIGLNISETQTLHLNGSQVLRHARDRSSGGNDYMRTQRQREVVMAVVKKARSGGLGNLAAKANQILPYVNHNIDAGTLAMLLANIGTYANFNFVQMRIPMDGTITGSVRGNLVMDYQRNSTAWKNLVY